MSSSQKDQRGERSQWNFKINKKSGLKPGDVIKIIDETGKTLEFGYITNDIFEVDGMPIANITLQRNMLKVEMVVTDAIQKI